MTISYVEYDLQDGYINNWLIAGPQATLVESTDSKEALPSSSTLKSDSKKSGITKMPVERGPLTEGLFKIRSYEGSWSYLRCAEDHYVDLSATFPVQNHLRAWAYTQVTSTKAQLVGLTIESCGPADVWLNKKHIFKQENTAGHPVPSSFHADLAEGKNEIMVRFEAIAAPVGRLIVSMRITGGDGLGVRIPTLIPSISRRNELEEVYQKVYLNRDIYSIEDEVYLHWPAGGEKSTYNDVLFKGPSGMIQAQAEDVGLPGDSLFLGYAQTSDEGTYRAIVMPRAWEYYDSNIRITRELKAILVGKSRFAARLYGSLPERSHEALTYAAQKDENLFAEIARMALGHWQTVNVKHLIQAVEQVDHRQFDSSLTVLGLVGMLHRFGRKAELPDRVKKLGKECLLRFRYCQDEPGADTLPRDTENTEIVLLASEILAGQLYPDQIFTNSGLTGRQHRQKAEKLAVTWMQKRGALGFSNWDSPFVFADVFTALSHLVELARYEPIWGLASVLQDKLLFSMALNSYQGMFASTRGNTSTSELKSSLLEPTSGVSRGLWGLGIFNSHIYATVSAALMQKYELPANIAEIAAFWPEELWSLEQQAAGETPVNKVMYRTPDYMLSSAQDYCPGETGGCEHIWQATLGPKSVVFSNHPACMSEEEECQPNFWRGNGVLPRVAQWKDVLIALYRLPEDDRLGFTHAYFPTINFDEYILRDHWAFARHGDGYIALTASQPLELVQQGKTANRELRAYGKETAWLCQMGRMALDGDFSTFQEKILGLNIEFEGLNVSAPTLRGEQLSFSWEGPFQRDGFPQPLKDFKHFENPYCVADLPCKQMEVRTMEYLLRLDFGDLP